LLGFMALEDSQGAVTPLAIVHAFVRNQDDGWSQTLSYLGQFLEEAALLPAEEVEARTGEHTVYFDRVRQLGRRTAELHKAWAIDPGDPAFGGDPITADDLHSWREAVEAEAEKAFNALRAGLAGLEEPVRANAERLLASRDQVFQRIAAQVPSQV